MVYVDEKTLKEMFERAYEAGWRGSFDLKDDFVANLMKELASIKPEQKYDSSGYFSGAYGGTPATVTIVGTGASDNIPITIVDGGYHL